MPRPFDNIVIDLTSEKAIEKSFDEVEDWALRNDPHWSRIHSIVYQHGLSLNAYKKMLIITYFKMLHQAIHLLKEYEMNQVRPIIKPNDNPRS